MQIIDVGEHGGGYTFNSVKCHSLDRVKYKGRGTIGELWWHEASYIVDTGYGM